MPRTVLCADDDRNLCRIMAKALTAEGYRVQTVHDGESALARFREQPPDLVLLDLLLPRRDGFAVLQAMRDTAGPSADVPAVIISGCSRTPEYLERSEALRAAAFLTKPVPLEILLEQVRKALGSAPAVRGRPAPDPARRHPARGRRLQGSFAELPFPALLHQLHGLRANGVLLLRSGRRRKGVQFREGRPVAIRSNLVDECLGNLLVRMRAIDPETLQESLRRMKRGEGLQGQILVAMEVLSESDLMEALRYQTEEKLYEIFEWREGEFEFRRGARLVDATTLPSDRSPASIIVEGVRSRLPLAIVDRALRESSGSTVVAGEIPFYRFQDIGTGATHRGLLERLGRGVAMRELLDADESERRALYAFLMTGVVELRTGGGAPGPSAASPRAEGPSPRSATSPPRPGASSPKPAASSPPPAGAVREEPRPRPPEPDDADVRAELAAMAERMRGRNFFEILGVAATADDGQVRHAYVDLAKRTHPDRFSGCSEAVRRLAEEVFGLVSQANERLAEERGREDYRAELARGEREAEALEEARRALAAEQVFQRGEAALRAKRHTEAFEAFREAVELYPEEGEYLALLGWTRYLTAPDDPRARTETRRMLKRAAALAPDSEKPYLFLGLLCKGIGRIEQAERMFLRAVDRRSDCLEALRELRLINLRREKQKGLLQKILRR